MLNSALYHNRCAHKPQNESLVGKVLGWLVGWVLQMDLVENMYKLYSSEYWCSYKNGKEDPDTTDTTVMCRYQRKVK